jgi:hypothetical protein
MSPEAALKIVAPKKHVRWNTKYFIAFVLALLLFPSCADQEKSTTLDIALTDGTHTGGLLIAVDDNWLVLDETSEASPESPVTLLDYALVDTVTITGAKYSRAGAVLGGLLGAVSGIFVAGGLDSASPQSERSRTIIGFGAGLVVGAAAGYFIGHAYSDTDIVLPHPTDDDYVFLRKFALYPDSLPHDLKFALDSVDAADSINLLNNR